MAPASTGSARRSKTVVIATDHTNSEMRAGAIPLWRIFFTVVIKLIDLRIEEIPARCREKIARSTEGPL